MLDWEGSYKTTDVTPRSDASYNRLGIHGHLGWHWSMYNSVAFFQQQINEPWLLSVKDSQSIAIKQKEFYHLSAIQMNNRWQLKFDIIICIHPSIILNFKTILV